MCSSCRWAWCEGCWRDSVAELCSDAGYAVSQRSVERLLQACMAVPSEAARQLPQEHLHGRRGHVRPPTLPAAPAARGLLAFLAGSCCLVLVPAAAAAPSPSSAAAAAAPAAAVFLGLLGLGLLERALGLAWGLPPSVPLAAAGLLTAAARCCRCCCVSAAAVPLLSALASALLSTLRFFAAGISFANASAASSLLTCGGQWARGAVSLGVGVVVLL